MRTIISTTRATRVAKAAPCPPHDNKMMNIKLKITLHAIALKEEYIAYLVLPISLNEEE